ncbi:hypothetical protein PBI_EBERT_56 [Gordonia phage Ebert]|uniref:Uncharacterized protein n=1 Tax=Gordonia phage Ebert TaxID=2201426 RepID=A0A2Z4Q443_9CAUD|nr:tail fiber protein [Gordonia phage Ebert]AWY04724.1 hypothetical protein PBI_EBERT_56 [Gordonia phage Ebert]
MTAPAINPAAIDAALPDLNADVACEFGNECDRPAVWRVRVHGFRRPSQECANHALCLCDKHQVVQRDKIENILWPGPFRCAGCDRICRQVSDVIISVVAL